MKHTFLLLLFLSVYTKVLAQNQTVSNTNSTKPMERTGIDTTGTTGAATPPAEEIDFERPFNFFAAAGASYMFNNQYSVVVSPVDNTIQFEKTYPILTRFALGLVWNPLKDQSTDKKKQFFHNKKLDAAYKATREHAAIALLINIFQLGYTASEINTSSPIDVGFGFGYRSNNFLILGTLELTPIRSPRNYFTEQFKDKNKPLILAGSTEPVRTISLDDKSIFIDRIYPSIGIKIAYAFSKTIARTAPATATSTH